MSSRNEESSFRVTRTSRFREIHEEAALSAGSEDGDGMNVELLGSKAVASDESKNRASSPGARECRAKRAINCDVAVDVIVIVDVDVEYLGNAKSGRK